MFFHSGKLLLTAVLSGMCVVSAVPVEGGCHGRSGGSSYGSGYSSRMNYSQPVYTSPVYAQPVYSQPVYPQPIYLQSQPVYGQSQPMPQFGQGQQGYPVQQGYSGQPGFSAQQGYPSGGQSLQAGTQPMTQSGNPANVPAGGIQIPASGNSVNSSINDAQQSALQALGGFAPPQQTTVGPTTTPSPLQQTVPTQPASFVGIWNANLATGARIQLALQADGTFSWTAVNKDGQSSIFQGSYAVENGSLSLTRSSDRQQLSGTVTTTGANTFNFMLSVAQSSSLDFVRG